MTMTESEAINQLKENIDLPYGLITEEVSEIAIQALEEVQQYRAAIDLTEIQQYGTISTVKQPQPMKEYRSFTGVELAQIASMQIELKRYRAIGTVEECRAAVEKQKTKKPLRVENSGFRYTDAYRCPNCQKGFTGTGIAHFCYHCGQALDWGEEGF